MIRKLAFSVSMVVMVAAATSAGAETAEPPRWESCKDWDLREVGIGNWVNAPTERYWVCTSGQSKGRLAALGGIVASSSSSGDDSNGGTVPPPPPPPTKQKGNNGIGNGEDPQPPGNPKINDGPGSTPGKKK